MQSKLDKFQNDLLSQKSCQKCGTQSVSRLASLTIQISSLVDFNQKLQELLPKTRCFNCKVECCLLCGDVYDVESDTSSLGGESDDFLADDAFEQVQDLENRLFHCQETQAFVVYLILLQLEMLVTEDSTLANQRSERIARAAKKPKTNGGGIGYIAHKVDLSQDGKLWQSDTQICRRFVDDSIIPYLEILCNYLPDMERQANTADLMPHESFNAILQSSVLGPLVKRLLKSASIQDLIEHEKLFVSLSRLIGILAVHSETRSFVMEPLCADAGLLKFFNTGKCEIEAGKDTIQGLVGDIAKQTKVFIKVYNGSLSDDDPVSKIAAEIHKLSQKVGTLTQNFESSSFNGVDEVVLKVKPWDLEMPLPSQQVVSKYCTAMKEIAFLETDFQIASVSSTNPPSSSTKPLPDLKDPMRLKTIAKEIAVLSTSLPVDYCTSAFIRITQMRFDAFMLGLIGPEGTPYANGLFLFEVHFPPQYPQLPPQLKFLTTNSGHWRANPNLYANGKVCLSLLNTWATPQWLPGQSTLLQRPYFNEPGFGDPTDSPQSLAYSALVREGVVKNAMLSHLKSLNTSPQDPFGDVIRTHFKLKKLRILAQLEKWKTFQTNQKQFSNLCDSVAIELEKL